MKKYLTLLISTVSISLSQHAFSHAGFPQLIPMTFHPHDDVATIYLTRSDKFGEVEYVGPNILASEFKITNPEGKSYGANDENKLHYLQQLVVLEAEVKQEGTYKIELVRKSSLFPWAIMKGKAVDVRSRQAPKLLHEFDAETQAEIAQQSPEQQEKVRRNLAKALEKYHQDIQLKPAERGFFFADEVKEKDKYATNHVHYYTTYISKNKLTDTVLKTTGEGFEFDYKTHPNQITTQSGLQFTTLLNGKVLPAVNMVVIPQGDAPKFNVVSDQNGLVNIRFPKAGIYMISTTEYKPMTCVGETKTPANVKPAVNNGKVEMQHSCYYNNVVVEVKD